MLQAVDTVPNPPTATIVLGCLPSAFESVTGVILGLIQKLTFLGSELGENRGVVPLTSLNPEKVTEPRYSLYRSWSIKE